MTKRRKRELATSADQIPPRQVTCRVHHAWPSEDLVDGKKPPPGLWYELADKDTDMWHLNDQCPRCGSIRYQEMPGRVYMNNPWRRKYGPEWVKFGGRFTPRDALRENMTRNSAKLPLVIRS